MTHVTNIIFDVLIFTDSFGRERKSIMFISHFKIKFHILWMKCSTPYTNGIKKKKMLETIMKLQMNALKKKNE